MAEKKIPLRKCTGCNEMKPKKELVRVLKTPEDEIVLDKTGKKNGRGAYICKSAECFKQGLKKKCFYRAFGMNIPEDVQNQIEKEINGET